MNQTRTWTCLFVGLLAVAVALGAKEAEKPKSGFSALKAGQSVSLKDEGSAFTIVAFTDCDKKDGYGELMRSQRES